MNKTIPRGLTAILAACALALALWGGVPTPAAASPQATPMPTPMATAVPSPMATSELPSPMPNPIVTPASNPVPTAPSPGTDMLNNNPNGGNGSWLGKFNRQPKPEPNMTFPPNHPMIPPKCQPMVRQMMKTKITAAQHGLLLAKCKKITHM